jgi:hypothetical protein
MSARPQLKAVASSRSNVRGGGAAKHVGIVAAVTPRLTATGTSTEKHRNGMHGGRNDGGDSVGRGGGGGGLRPDS